MLFFTLISSSYSTVFWFSLYLEESWTVILLDLVGDGERGVITVLDTMSLSVGEDELGYDLQNQKLDGVVAHFVAHNKVSCA